MPSAGHCAMGVGRNHLAKLPIGMMNSWIFLKLLLPENDRRWRFLARRKNELKNVSIAREQKFAKKLVHSVKRTNFGIACLKILKGGRFSINWQNASKVFRAAIIWKTWSSFRQIRYWLKRSVGNRRRTCQNFWTRSKSCIAPLGLIWNVRHLTCFRIIFQFSLEMESRVELCECDIAEFEKAELLARRQFIIRTRR